MNAGASKKQKIKIAAKQLCVLVPQTRESVPTPYFWMNFLYRVKVYLNERPPWSELGMELEKHKLKCYAYVFEVRNYFTEGYYKTSLCRWM